jgi:hypothetical protein
MNGTLKIHQIYFKEDQIGLLEPEYWPFFNGNCTEFFEASVISKLVNELKVRDQFDYVNGEYPVDYYFGVVSYQLREKIGVMKELRSRQAFEKPSITRRMEIKRAAYRTFVQSQENK